MTALEQRLEANIEILRKADKSKKQIIFVVFVNFTYATTTFTETKIPLRCTSYLMGGIDEPSWRGFNFMERPQRLTYVKEVEPSIVFSGNRSYKRRAAIYICECGNESSYLVSRVKNGYTRQCKKCAMASLASNAKKHSLSKHPLFKKWGDMKRRCYNHNLKSYKDYGGRGISVCDGWRDDFINFYNWCLDNGYGKDNKFIIDREDCNGNYSPVNCRITDTYGSAENKRTSLMVNFNGKTVQFIKLIKEHGLINHYNKIYWRYKFKNEDIVMLINFYKKKTLHPQQGLY